MNEANRASVAAMPSRQGRGGFARRAPARRTTSADAVYDEIRAMIGDMELKPGTPLQEKVLTERFGVSRTPVREALLRLAEDGLVDIFPQSGTFVSRLPVEVIRESLVIRAALEDLAVAHCARIAGPADMPRIDAILSRQHMLDRAGDTAGFHAADEAFHEELVLIGGFPTMLRILRIVKVQINRARRLTLPVAGRMRQVIGEHTAIRAAIAANDAEAARAAMASHLRVMLPDVDRLRGKYPDYFI